MSTATARPPRWRPTTGRETRSLGVIHARRRRLTIVSLVAALLVVLVGCSDGDDAKGPTASLSTDDRATTTTDQTSTTDKTTTSKKPSTTTTKPSDAQRKKDIADIESFLRAQTAAYYRLAENPKNATKAELGKWFIGDRLDREIATFEDQVRVGDQNYVDSSRKQWIYDIKVDYANTPNSAVATSCELISGRIINRGTNKQLPVELNTQENQIDLLRTANGWRKGDSTELMAPQVGRAGCAAARQ